MLLCWARAGDLILGSKWGDLGQCWDDRGGWSGAPSLWVSGTPNRHHRSAAHQELSWCPSKGVLWHRVIPYTEGQSDGPRATWARQGVEFGLWGLLNYYVLKS